MRLSEDLAWRGLIKDKTFKDSKWLDNPGNFYLGIDASSDSLHIGNLAILLLARRLLEAGWQTTLLAGGATSLIGDPKETEERELKPREEIQENVKAIKIQIKQLFAGKDFDLVDNYDWFKDIGYLDFLRDVGKSFAMSELMQREFIIERLNSGISYAEFSYSLIQGYDYLQLHNKQGVVLQIGGSDQWANMLSGVSLIRKKKAKEVHALSMPLIVNQATGRKFGKSEEGTIWLDPKKTSPTQFYQFWINSSDEDTEDYLKIFTILPKDKINEITKDHKKNPAERQAQKALAEHVTELVHGHEETQTARVITNVLTGKTAVGDVSPGIVQQMRKEIASSKLPKNTKLIDALVATKLVASNTEARRLLSSKAVYINGQATDKEKFDADDFQSGRLLLRRGKAHKDSALVELM